MRLNLSCCWALALGLAIGSAIGQTAPLEVPEADKSYHVVDLLVVYTVDLAQAAEPNQIVALAGQGVDYFNTALRNSRVDNVRLRLVMASAVDFREDGDLDRALSWLDESDHVRSLRAAMGADLVCMFTLYATVAENSATLGKARYLSSGGQYSVVALGDQYVLAHELGHNFGCDHDTRVSPKGAFPYSHCLSFNMPTDSGTVMFGTIMSRGHQLPYFSNPSLIYTNSYNGGRFLLGMRNLNDNARTIRNTAATVANHMPSRRSLFEGTRSENKQFLLEIYGFDPKVHVVEWSEDFKSWRALPGLVDPVYCDGRFYRMRVK